MSNDKPKAGNRTAMCYKQKQGSARPAFNGFRHAEPFPYLYFRFYNLTVNEAPSLLSLLAQSRAVTT